MRRLALLLAAVALLLCTGQVDAGLVVGPAGEEIDYRIQGGLLSNTTDYDWWYGCSPTSAGMMMGHYDRNGYGGLVYPDLVPGGVAEASTFGNPGAIANQIIASAGHIADFWGSPDPLGSGRTLPGDFDCLADFMGTSQDGLGGGNGWTTFWMWTNGAKFYAEDSFAVGVWNSDGMYGVGEYVQHAGYDYGDYTLYTQYTDNMGRTFGFSLAEFQSEIDAGRPVLVHVTGHTMFGWGYVGSTIYVADTWNPGPHTMPWGGSYSGLDMWGVTVLSGLQGGIPEPASVIIWSLLGGVGVAFWYRRRRAA